MYSASRVKFYPYELVRGCAYIGWSQEMFSNLSILQVRKKRCCLSSRWSLVQMDRGNVWCCKLHLYHVRETATASTRNLRWNHKEKNHRETTWGSYWYNSKASRENFAQNRRQRNLLEIPKKVQEDDCHRSFMDWLVQSFLFHFAGIRLTTGGFTFFKIL